MFHFSSIQLAARDPLKAGRMSSGKSGNLKVQQLLNLCRSFLCFIYFRHQLLQTPPHQKAVPRLPPNAVAQRWEFQIVQGFPNLNFNCQKKFSPTFWENCWGLHWFGAKSNLSQFMYFCVKQKFTPKSCSRSKKDIYHVCQKVIFTYSS